MLYAGADRLKGSCLSAKPNDLNAQVGWTGCCWTDIGVIRVGIVWEISAFGDFECETCRL